MDLGIRVSEVGVRSGVAHSMLATAVLTLLASCVPAGKGTDLAKGLTPGMSAAGGPVTMHRLTEVQYRNIIADVFGGTIRLGGRFEPDVRVEHLISVGAGQASVTAAGLEQYDKIARSVGEQVVDEKNRDQLIECKPASAAQPDEACARRFLSRVGRLLYRRPLTDQEAKAYIEAATAAAAKTGNFYKGISLALGGMMTAPQFLYRQEFSEPDPVHKGQQRLDAYSKAQRLSFLLWNAAPDPMLLAAAEKGELHTLKGLAREVDRMLASPRIEAGARAFFIDMFEFDTFDTLAKDATLYPKFTFAVAAQAREQTLRTVMQLLVRENGDYRDIFTTQKTFLTPSLGSLYGVPTLAPEGMPDAWLPYEFAARNRQSGILTHASFVALHSHPGRSSPTLRGKALREILLCSRVPDPPANVNFTLVQETNNPLFKTARARLKAHATEAMCTGCHKITDPMGLALENFDTIGGYRDEENGAQIDTSGELDGVQFTDAVGLGKAVHDNPRATSCLVHRLYDYAVGRQATKSEDGWRADVLEKQFAADNYRFPALLRRIAASDVFFRVMPAEGDENAAQPESKK